MAAAKKSMKKSPLAKSPVKKAAKKAPLKKASLKKMPAKEAAAKKAPVTKSPAKKEAAKVEVSVRKTSTPKKPPAKTPERIESLVGKSAPSFQLQDQSGSVVSSASLKGKPYVLYFYPKDNTPGCTQESCEFRDEHRNFRASGVTVFGVSPDSVKSHAGFASKYELPFPLLSDPEKVLAQAYGVWALKKNYGREYWGIVRSTFLVDKKGKIAAEWRQVRVSGHASVVLFEAKK